MSVLLPLAATNARPFHLVRPGSFPPEPPCRFSWFGRFFCLLRRHGDSLASSVLGAAIFPPGWLVTSFPPVQVKFNHGLTFLFWAMSNSCLTGLGLPTPMWCTPFSEFVSKLQPVPLAPGGSHMILFDQFFPGPWPLFLSAPYSPVPLPANDSLFRFK